ncbi:MAG: hypothetical protein LBK58_04060 [Prevotellaceae bacterium]|jgi:hypothetical protein|nr:hypothetical protein [Prevotellaceae bacterium]
MRKIKITVTKTSGSIPSELSIGVSPGATVQEVIEALADEMDIVRDDANFYLRNTRGELDRDTLKSILSTMKWTEFVKGVRRIFKSHTKARYGG